MVSTGNPILTLSRQSLGSSDPQVVLSPIASSLPVSQDLVPLPSSSLGEHLPTSNHTFRRTKKKGGRYRKRNPKSPTSGYHASHHPHSASTNNSGGKVPISNHHDGYHAGT